MKCLKTLVYARAGLLGNPSDGYFGKTISTIVKNFSARVSLHESPVLEVILGARERYQYKGIEHLVEDVRLHGLCGGSCLTKAAIKVFAEHCQEQGIQLPAENFSLRCESDIPRQVGLGGSSAIIIAVLRG